MFLKVGLSNQNVSQQVNFLWLCKNKLVVCGGKEMFTSFESEDQMLTADV